MSWRFCARIRNFLGGDFIYFQASPIRVYKEYLNWMSRKWLLNSNSVSLSHTHLSSKDPTHANDAKNVEHSWADDGPHPHITVGDEDTCTQKATHQSQMTLCVRLLILLTKSGLWSTQFQRAEWGLRHKVEVRCQGHGPGFSCDGYAQGNRLHL